ncbi:sigma-70 family RNA polymerase sigma factor [Opitutus sp. ER46]|uniref:RNA polymerase sigma factor n=1 Tax=Opitutus sp. ER46 TaxID=2161864 RepID=UPI000D321649|nr:sigma-70 family RNA polymerase sigma factor [Opitutus sp. ER46]PTX95580.1 hypothetical protein DB354_09175 [Opitutus sp. ER46]
MTSTPLSPTLPADADLVAQSLAGDRQAFGQIVGRYQSLVCALAYSATGSRAHSEDLAQETFVAAWRGLRDLQEPSRLRPWLCGIARRTIANTLRRLGRQPAHAAAPLDSASDVPADDAQPTSEVVSNEEMALLWREVGRLPATYREPLILFYREHRSVEAVAAALDLTPEATMQRLTRGRRLLHERMLAFIESTLERTNPGPQFTLQVEHALPLLIGTGPAISTATTVAHGGGAAKGGFLGTLLTWAAPLIGLFAAIGISWTILVQAPTPRERRFLGRWLLLLWLATLGFVLALPAAGRLAFRAGLHERQDWLATAPVVAVWFGIAMIDIAIVTFLIRGKATLRRELAAAGSPSAPRVPPSPGSELILTAAVLIALFWTPIFVAWRTGDHAVAWAVVGLMLGLLGWAAWWGRRHPAPADGDRLGGWFIVICALLFLGLINWRLNVWLAPVYRVDLATMNRLLPPMLLHGLSAIAIAWAAVLVRLTRPRAKA